MLPRVIKLHFVKNSPVKCNSQKLVLSFHYSKKEYATSDYQYNHTGHKQPGRRGVFAHGYLHFADGHSFFALYIIKSVFSVRIKPVIRIAIPAFFILIALLKSILTMQRCEPYFRQTLHTSGKVLHILQVFQVSPTFLL